MSYDMEVIVRATREPLIFDLTIFSPNMKTLTIFCIPLVFHLALSVQDVPEFIRTPDVEEETIWLPARTTVSKYQSTRVVATSPDPTTTVSEEEITQEVFSEVKTSSHAFQNVTSFLRQTMNVVQSTDFETIASSVSLNLHNFIPESTRKSRSHIEIFRRGFQKLDSQ